MHVVLYDSKYAKFEDALNKTNGLAVLAFLFEVCTSDIPSKGDNVTISGGGVMVFNATFNNISVISWHCNL